MNALGLHLFQQWLNDPKKNQLIDFNFLPEINSTSDFIKNNSVADGTLILTDCQYSGHGRRSNKWESAPGDNFTGSWCFLQNSPPSPLFPALVGLKLIQLCDKFFPQHSWSLKAPNDIFLNGKKCAGILVEVLNKGEQTCTIIGLGFNVHSGPEASEFLASTLIDLENVQQQFYNLINAFGLSLSELIKSTCLVLTPDEARQILFWLQKNPKLQEIYGERLIELSPRGDLIFDHKTISWMEL